MKVVLWYRAELTLQRVSLFREYSCQIQCLCGTPVTSLMVGLMDSGMENPAEQTLSSTFGLSQDLDLTSYDPYENSAMGKALAMY